MGMYSRYQGPIAKPSARTKTMDEALAIAPRQTRALAKRAKAEPLENELETCERAITNSFRDVALAFEKIKRKHLYKLAGYETFEEYCEKRWNRTRQRGYQFAAAGAVLKSLPDSMSNFVDTEDAARALSAVPEEKRVEVLKTVSKGGSVTAKAELHALDITDAHHGDCVGADTEFHKLIRHLFPQAKMISRVLRVGKELVGGFD